MHYGLSYTYDASGTRLAKIVEPTSGTTVTTDYLGGFQYENNDLQFFFQPEGYVKKDENAYLYVFQYKDHLGNNRLNYADLNGDGEIQPITEIIEENNYYPFGLRHKGYNDIANSCRNEAAERYKFGGKEWNDELGFEVYDFGARNYDPALGRWMNIDPLAEEFYEWTGYNYTLNNPVNNIDPDGMFTLSGVAAQNFARQLQSDLEQEEMRKLMSGEGREDDYGIDDTGKITLLKNTNDKFDRLFEVDKDGNKKKRGNSFLIRKAKRGQEIIAVDNIAKGILREVINLKEDNVKFKVNGEGQPTLAEFDDFISRFSDYLRKEIAGVRLGDDLSPNVTSVLTYRYHGNDKHTSQIDESWLIGGYNGVIGKNNYVKAHFHTHPYGDHRPSSEADIPLRNGYKNLPFYIIAGGYEKSY